MEDTGMIFAEKTALRGAGENPRTTPGTYSEVAAGERPGAGSLLHRSMSTQAVLSIKEALPTAGVGPG